MVTRRLLVGLGGVGLALAVPAAAAGLAELDGPASVDVPAVRVKVPETPPAPPPPATTTTIPSGPCHRSYPTVCIPPPPPDLNCPDVPFLDFVVVGDDPHGFDGDRDGIGCES